MRAITRTLRLSLTPETSTSNALEHVYVRSSDALRELRSLGFVALCLAFATELYAEHVAAVRLQHAEVLEAFYLVPAIEFDGRSLVRLEDALPAAHGLDEQRHMPPELLAMCKGVQLTNLAAVHVYVERPPAQTLTGSSNGSIQVTFVGVSL
jgi:hypothetical protein